MHAANIHDTTIRGQIFESALKEYPTLEGACFDAGYRGTTVNYVKNILGKIAEISLRIVEEWSVLPVRWVVERTFSWLNSTRRLAKDFEISISSSENFIMISHIMLLLKRLG